jgi:hypothetical protein
MTVSMPTQEVRRFLITVLLKPENSGWFLQITIILPFLETLDRIILALQEWKF